MPCHRPSCLQMNCSLFSHSQTRKFTNSHAGTGRECPSFIDDGGQHLECHFSELLLHPLSLSALLPFILCSVLSISLFYFILVGRGREATSTIRALQIWPAPSVEKEERISEVTQSIGTDSQVTVDPRMHGWLQLKPVVVSFAFSLSFSFHHTQVTCGLWQKGHKLTAQRSTRAAQV